MKYYDNTIISSYRSCPRMMYFRHIRDWRREATSAALVFGSSWHSAQDFIWAHAADDMTDDALLEGGMAAFLQKWTGEGYPSWGSMSLDEQEKLSPRTPGIAAEMLLNYIALRRDFIRGVEVMGIEQPFAVPLIPSNPHIFYVGKLDKVVLWNGKVWVIEHKTTSSYLKSGPFRNSFIDSFSPNSQIDGYSHAIHMLYPEQAKGVMIDAALVHKTVHDGFKFIPIERMTTQIGAWLFEAWDWIEKIEQDKERYQGIVAAGPSAQAFDFLAAFPKNTNSCQDFGGCSYLDLCKSRANPETYEDIPAGFKVEKWEPFNLLQLDKIGLEKET